MDRVSHLSSNLAWQLSAVLLTAAAILICWGLGRLQAGRRPRRPLVNRITEKNFTTLLSHDGIEPRVAATVYRYLREIQTVFTAPLPQDHLVWDLGMTEKQVEETVADLSRRLDRSSVSASSQRSPGTPAELARLLQQMPGKSSSATSRAA